MRQQELQQQQQQQDSLRKQQQQEALHKLQQEQMASMQVCQIYVLNEQYVYEIIEGHQCIINNVAFIFTETSGQHLLALC